MASNGDNWMGSLGLLVLRVGMGGLLLCAHGWDKVTHMAARAKTFPDPLHIGSAMSFGLVVFAETACALFVALGLFTRAALIPIIIFLCVGFFVYLAPQPWGQKEMAIVYLVPFLALFFTGAGRFALDSWIGLRRKSG
jgi:putative oxidoreductase